MAVLELAFASQETSLSVRTFSVREGMSKLFEVSIFARSEFHELDLDTFIGKSAAFLAHAGVGKGRSWNGVCSHAEHVRAEPQGLSTYYFRIVPDMWRTTQRRNARVFQQKTVPEIVTTVFADWHIHAELRLEGDFPKHEYRVQYDETDYVFVTRLLEEAGIAYHFEHEEIAEGDAAKPGHPTKLVLCDAPHAKAPRAGGPIHHTDEAMHAGKREHVSKARLSHQSKAGRVTVRDTDFRTRPDYQLLAEARETVCEEDRYEHFHYQPGAFLVVGERKGETPHADDRGAARVDERKHGQSVADKKLAAHRVDRRRVTFSTNCMDLAPGTVTSMSDHPRADLGADKHLLVTEGTLEGSHGSDWSVSCEAVFTSQTYRPKQVTQRPKVFGVQSAMVVGPAGEEIHCDEFGRVRVQFHWDRQGKFTEESSCWVRVSQAWAGSSYGMMAIPRVGQEVLVEFFEGDPDRPIITGRVYNNTTRVPYKLPDDKTKSGWKSASSPGADGFNELMFEDKKGAELISIQAQKDLSIVVKDSESHVVNRTRATNIGDDEALTVGRHRTINVGLDDVTTVGGDVALDVIGSREVAIAGSDTINVGESFTLRLGEHTGVAMSEGRLVLTSGGSSVVLTETGIHLDAVGDVTIAAGGKLVLSGAEVAIDGAPMVEINCGEAATPVVAILAAALLPCGPDEVIVEGEIVEGAIVLEGEGQWVIPGELCETVAATPPFIAIEGLKTCDDSEGEIAILAGDACEVVEVVDVAVDDMSLVEAEVHVHGLLAAAEGKRLGAAIDKFKLYGGLVKHHTVKDVMHAAPKIFGPKVGKKIAEDLHAVAKIGAMLGAKGKAKGKSKLVGSCCGKGGMNGLGHVHVGHGGGGGHPGNAGHGGHHPGQGGHPGHGVHHPGQGGHHPGQGGQPGHGTHQPGQGGQPGHGTHQPGQGGQPGHGTHQPGQGGQPGHGTHQPGQGGQPGHGTHQPGQGGQAGHGTHQPGQGGQAGHGTHQPGQGGQAGHGTHQPGQGQVGHAGGSQSGQVGGHAGHAGGGDVAKPSQHIQQGGAQQGHVVQGSNQTGHGVVHGSGGSQASQQGTAVAHQPSASHSAHTTQPNAVHGTEAMQASAAKQHPVHAVPVSSSHAPALGGAAAAGHASGTGSHGGHAGSQGGEGGHRGNGGQGGAHGGHGGGSHPSHGGGHGGAGPEAGPPAAPHGAVGGDAHAAAAPAAAQPQKQYMTMKTAQTPYHVDESQVHAHTQRYVAAGHTPEQAHAKALKHHGIALYEGDGAGHFKKVPG